MPSIDGRLEWDDDELTPGKKKEGGLHSTLFDADGNLIKRGRGKPLNAVNERAVLALKAEGATQQQAAAQLGLALTSVREYWRK